MKEVTFRIAGAKGKNVAIAGSFNDWNTESHKMSFRAGKYSIKVKLGKGQHQYKFIVDGEWHTDPDCEAWVHNDLGSVNSVIVID
ncbi:hypothetical protein BVX97_03285 [bacterium E08(2017)]|nr:hypothetical protein BVX97_03285 [bacterium E08(2017)]